MQNSEILQNLKKSIENWDMGLMRKTVQIALDAAIDPQVIISDGLAKGMETISTGFDQGKLYLPQIIAASKVMEAAMSILSSKLENNGGQYKGIVVMGSVAGDIHEIGKDICIAMLRGACYKVVDLGPDVSSEEFIDAAVKHSADVVGASALMTTTLNSQRMIVDERDSQKSDVLLFFGGAPCTQKWVESIKGDGYSKTGYEMVKKIDEAVGSDKQHD